MAADWRDQMARETHGMWHAGATDAEILERIRARLTAASGASWDQIPRLLRPLIRRAERQLLALVTTPAACGPDHAVVICDARQV